MTAINPFALAPARKNRTASKAAVAAAHVQAEAPDRPNFVSIYASTILVMSVVFLLGIAVPIAMVYGNAAGWGIGAACAFWGGPSFGVMAASARVSAWYEKHGKEL